MGEGTWLHPLHNSSPFYPYTCFLSLTKQIRKVGICLVPHTPMHAPAKIHLESVIEVAFANSEKTIQNKGTCATTSLSFKMSSINGPATFCLLWLLSLHSPRERQSSVLGLEFLTYISDFLIFNVSHPAKPIKMPKAIQRG